MSFKATNETVTKTIKENMVASYIKMGWNVTWEQPTDEEEKEYNPYNYGDVAEENRLEPIIINGEAFEGYSSFQCINTKTYIQEPVRTENGSIPNINDYVTFIVPRVQVSFDYMKISDFRRFLKAITPNEFDVQYYDYELGKKVTRKMYIEPREMSKIFNKGYEVLAVTGEKISLIGTLNEEEDLTIEYYDNASYTNESDNKKYYYHFETQRTLLGNWYYILNGNQFSHHKEENDTKKYTFSHWSEKPNPDEADRKWSSLDLFQADRSLKLYAQWVVEETESESE